MAVTALALTVRELALLLDQAARDADIPGDQHIAGQRDVGDHPVMHAAKLGKPLLRKADTIPVAVDGELRQGLGNHIARRLDCDGEFQKVSQFLADICLATPLSADA